MNEVTIKTIEDSLIIFDTSTVIELYYYPEEVLSIIEESILKKYPDKFYLPHEVTEEYESKREEKKNVPSNSYNSLLTKSSDNGYIFQIESTLKKLSTTFKTLSEYAGKANKHPFLKEPLLKELEKAIKKGEQEIKDSITPIKKEIEDKIKENDIKTDKVKELLDTHFKIGRKFKFSEKLQIADEGAKRFDLLIPPGWADGEGKDAKEGLRKYNDLIIWKQICEISKSFKSDIIYITKDYAKDDWCNRSLKSSYIDSPKKELIDELEEISGKKLRMFSLKQFLTYSSKVLSFDLDPSKLEVRSETESFIIKQIYTENKSHDCWGVSQILNGVVYISDKEIRIKVTNLELTNENGINWYVPSISANIAYTNENRRWAILKAGESQKIDVELPKKSDSITISDLDLVINREGIESLDNLWLVFKIDTYSDKRKSYGTMYNHWKGLN